MKTKWGNAILTKQGTGKSYEELAEKYNCSRATIGRRIGKVN